MKVTVMGLGLNGGGLASVRFLAEQGALVTATDLRSASVLEPSISSLKDLDIRYVLEEHRMEDFENADMVIKNPAVPPTSPYLKAAQRVETDISLFLSLCSNPILAVTGSKGKSTVVSALHHILIKSFPRTRLGGNITVSPLSFLKELKEGDPVVLELSSWQLGDLKNRDLLHPDVSVLTNIMNDHQNMYASMTDYADDKKVIFRGQNKNQYALFLKDDWGVSFAEECPARSLYYTLGDDRSGDLHMEGEEGIFVFNGVRENLLPEVLKTPGEHFRLNCLIAAGAARLFGVDRKDILEQLADFPGVPHRLELVKEHDGIRYYNDTTATIPEAMAAGIMSFSAPLHLICGGNDKVLDYAPVAATFASAGNIYLLKGTATEKMIRQLDRAGKSYNGPFESLKDAFDAARKNAVSGDVVLMSPGATSFGMFINEFDRGNQFRALAGALGSDAGQKNGSPL